MRMYRCVLSCDFRCKDPNGAWARMELRRFRLSPKVTGAVRDIWIAEEVAYNPGMSVTDAAGEYLRAVDDVFRVDRDSFLWIEHYQDDDEPFSSVDFPADVFEGTPFTDRPTWRPMTEADVDALIGSPFRNRPEAQSTVYAR